MAERGAGTAELPTAADTIALGARLGRELRAGDVVVLSGPLGAGKTVLAKGIAQAMDVDGPVISPTFVLARVHRPRNAEAPAMIHVDLYRLLDDTSVDLLAELDSLDLDTDLDDAVVVVEWGEGRGRAAVRQPSRHPARTRHRHRGPHGDVAVERVVSSLILAIDTATPAVTAGVVRRDGDAIDVLAQRVTLDARAHAEQLTPNAVGALADAGIDVGDLEAIVVGCGPGPFTGLRVGMATAAAYGHALGLPVHGVCSLDAIGIERRGRRAGRHGRAPARGVLGALPRRCARRGSRRLRPCRSARRGRGAGAAAPVSHRGGAGAGGRRLESRRLRRWCRCISAVPTPRRWPSGRRRLDDRRLRQAETV